MSAIFQTCLLKPFESYDQEQRFKFTDPAGIKSLVQEIPTLPGPASVVRHVPTWTDLAVQLTHAGFTSLRFETLSEKAHFTVGDVEMREFLLVAQKPGHRPAKLSHSAIYLGPLAAATDDFGNVFRRSDGKHGRVSLRVWAAGERVKTGQVLGRLGNSGSSDAPHLHFPHGGFRFTYLC